MFSGDPYHRGYSAGSSVWSRLGTEGTFATFDVRWCSAGKASSVNGIFTTLWGSVTYFRWGR